MKRTKKELVKEIKRLTKQLEQQKKEIDFYKYRVTEMVKTDMIIWHHILKFDFEESNAFEEINK